MLTIAWLIRFCLRLERSRVKVSLNWNWWTLTGHSLRSRRRIDRKQIRADGEEKRSQGSRERTIPASDLASHRTSTDRTHSLANRRVNNLRSHQYPISSNRRQWTACRSCHEWGRSSRDHSLEDDWRGNQSHWYWSVNRTWRALRITSRASQGGRERAGSSPWSCWCSFLQEQQRSHPLTCHRSLLTEQRNISITLCRVPQCPFSAIQRGVAWTLIDISGDVVCRLTMLCTTRVESHLSGGIEVLVFFLENTHRRNDTSRRTTLLSSVSMERRTYHTPIWCGRMSTTRTS